MKPLPRRPIEPLSPPPGSFDAVLARARYRRHRRAGTVLTVSAVFLAGIVGGMSLDGGVRDSFVRFATADEGTTATQQPPDSASVTPKVDATKQPRQKKSPEDSVRAVPPPAPRMVTGVAVDAAGGPIAGLYVYTGRPGSDQFLARSEPADQTAADGSFSLACPGTPVLLAPWRVNVPGETHKVRAVWAATFVGGGTEAASAPDAPCSSDGKVVKTTLLPGSTLEGTVTMPAECADAARPLWLWLHNDRSLTVRLSKLRSGDTFSVGGLPPGQHTVGANGNRTLVTVGGGTTFTHDVTFSCEPGSPPETPTPTPTATTPVPTPSETPTSLPTGSTPPGPSGSSSPPTPTGTATTQP